MTLMTFIIQNFVNKPKPLFSCGSDVLCVFVRPDVVWESDVVWDVRLLSNSYMSWPVEGSWRLLKHGNIQGASQALHTDT